MRLTTTGFQTALEDFLGPDTGPQVLAYAATHRAGEQLAGYPALLTLTEVADVLGTDTQAVLSITGNDLLPAIEIGTSIRRYRREDVHDYLRFRSENPAPSLA